MSDGSEVTFQDDGVLFTDGNFKLAQIILQSVEITLHAIPRRLQTVYVAGCPLFVHRKISLFLLCLRRLSAACVLSSSGFGGTIEEGVFYAMLFYAMLCVPDVTFRDVNVTF